MCALLTELFGIDFVPEQYGSWGSLKKGFDTMEIDFMGELTKLSSGEISLVTELIYSEAREKEFTWVDMPYLTTSCALLSRADYPILSPQQVIRANVGAMRGSVYEDMYNAWFPDNGNQMLYNTQNDVFRALEKGEIDLMMATELMLVTQTNYRENPGYKINISFNTPVVLLLGLNKHETQLRSIINKAMTHINIEAISRSWASRTFDYLKKMANMRARYLLFFSVYLLIVLLAVVILLLKTKRLSKDLVRQTEEAKIASRAKSTFLAHMSRSFLMNPLRRFRK